ncbi:hypothetical protein [Hymenobacter canadensis]|uniref:TonB C-terminal domain-containing protein n=1 Tax=Hymenobacter canadensis TaxID=2999067 RepID=A0ABY7LV02_9BACT|nr:hypothetical protein [Hymenobacter canadensis]WBA44211.1 hypothetical protein O3303_20195 [Hymenobacter canadensis]
MKGIFSFLLATMFLPHVERQDEKRVYLITEVERLPQVIYEKKVLSINAYLRTAFHWKRGMDEGEKIVFSYVVGAKGQVTNLRVLEHPQVCSLCKQELLRLMKAIPRVVPAQRAGKSVAVKMTTIYHFEVAGSGKWE